MEVTINFLLASGIPEDEVELLLKDAIIKLLPTGESYAVIIENIN